MTAERFTKGLIIHNPFDGSHYGSSATPLAESYVLAGPDQVHPPLVVWVLVEDPVTVSHVAGKDSVCVEAVHEAGAVFLEVHFLTAKLQPLVQTQVEGARFLLHGCGRYSKSVR